MTARIGEQLAAQPDQAAAGNAEFNAHASVAVIVHVVTSPLREPSCSITTPRYLRHIDCEMLDRLHQLASFVVALGDGLPTMSRSLRGASFL